MAIVGIYARFLGCILGYVSNRTWVYSHLRSWQHGFLLYPPWTFKLQIDVLMMGGYQVRLIEGTHYPWDSNHH